MARSTAQTAAHQVVPRSVDVAIVGGGLVGYSLAALLSKEGLNASSVNTSPLKVAVLDAHSADMESMDSQDFDARSTALSAGSVGIFERIGLWPAIAPYATKIKEVQVSDKQHPGTTAYSVDDQGLDALGYVVENHYLNAQLIDSVKQQKGLHVLKGVQVTHCQVLADGAKLMLQQKLESERVIKKNITAKLVVLADGAHSPLAQSLGIDFDRHDYQQSAFITNVVHQRPHDGRAFERFTEQGPLALLPLTDYKGQSRSALVWTRCVDQVPKYEQLSDVQFLQHLQAEFGVALGRFTAIGKRYQYPLALVCAQEQVRRSLVLVGNAAHFLHPVAGQGFNLALRDANELAKALGQAQIDIGDMSVLDNYMAAREHDQWLTTQLSHQFIALFASRHPVKRLIRNAGLVTMAMQPKIKSWFFHQMMGLNSQS